LDLNWTFSYDELNFQCWRRFNWKRRYRIRNQWTIWNIFWFIISKTLRSHIKRGYRKIIWIKIIWFMYQRSRSTLKKSIL